jgi:hypothetical protein
VTWLSLIATALSIIATLTKWAERQGYIEAALSAAVLSSIREANDAISEARSARQAVRDRIAADPASVREPDEFERRD